LFDLFPIEGKHGLARAISNGTGGFCFRVESIEQGLALFEREAVLNLADRAQLHRQIPNKPLDQLEAVFDYVIEPKIKTPDLSSPAAPKIPNVSSSTSRIQRILSEYKNLSENPHPCFQIFITTNNVTLWKIIYTGEQDTPYQGHSWLLFVQFSEEFPLKPPMVRFATPFYHCNINNDGKICHDILGTGWKPEESVSAILEKLAVTIKVPNVLNSLDSVKGSLFVDNRQEYLKQAKAWSEKHGKTSKQLQTEFKLDQ